MGAPTIVRFHGFVLDMGRRTLTSGGRPVHLTRKAFDVLLTLVREAPRVVSKEELHSRVWPDAFVSDATVAGVIKELRRELGDRNTGTPIVRTAHGVGYAFDAAIETAPPTRQAQCWLRAGAERLPLAEGANEIGRHPQAKIWLDGPQVSRRHARITIHDGVAVLEDLGSKNRTLLNDGPVTRAMPLSNGDVIQIGSAMLLFHIADVESTTELGPAAGSDR